MIPGFHINQSNRLERLVARLAADVARTPLSSALASELVVVQQRTVGTWVDLAIAQATGISANIRYLSPGELIWELYRSTHSDIPQKSHFDPEILRWRIVEILNDKNFVDAHEPLKRYIERGNAARTFDLASRLANLFDSYLVYRMDWLDTWEAGKTLKLGPDEKWQAALWARLSNGYPIPHRGKLFRSFLGKLGGDMQGLPERINVFGISSLSPAYIRLLCALSARMSVNVYILNPCRKPWSAIIDERKAAALDIAYTPDLLQIDVPHPLLASFGKQGQDFIHFVTAGVEAGMPSGEDFEDPGADSLLHVLQGGILDLQEKAMSGRAGDDSIRIHSCHTPMREVEVLHDQLMDLFEKDATLRPSDVMVLAPDINVYAPYIEAVFPKALIPYDIADRAAGQVDVVVETWMALFGLIDTRFEAETIVDLLRLRPMAEAFGIDQEEVDTLVNWIAESGIRWGRDAVHKRELALPETDLFTWAWGLERMSLGVALPRAAAGKELPLYEGMLPFDSIEGQSVDLLDRFLEFVDALRAWVADLRKPKPVGEWGVGLNGWLDRFFPMKGPMAESREKIREAVGTLVRSGDTARFSGDLDDGVIRRFMEGELREEQERSRFLAGGITFCSMKPMRSLPFRIIYLLGISDSEFPRERRPPSFDLMRSFYRYGDRSGRLDDRYLFLELLLSARDRFVISYVGEDVRTGKSLPMSTVTNELLDFLGKIAFQNPAASSDTRSPRERAENALAIRHPLQAISVRYFDGSDARLFSYSAEACAAGNEIGSGGKLHHVVFPTPLSPPTEESHRVRLSDLAAFYQNPTKYLFNKRLNIYLRREEESLESLEPLVVGKGEIRSVNRAAFDSIASGRMSHDGLYKILLADGKLPLDTPGRVGFEEALKTAAPFIAGCTELFGQARLEPLSEEVTVGTWTLEIDLENLTPGGMFRVKPGKISSSDTVSFWIQFLGAMCIHPERDRGPLQAVLLGTDRKQTLKAIDKPLALIEHLLRFYETGLTRPLQFFCKSASIYAENILDGKPKGAALAAASKEWDPEGWGDYKECDDEYYARVFFSPEEALTEEFCMLAELIAVPAMGAVKEEKFGEEKSEKKKPENKAKVADTKKK